MPGRGRRLRQGCASATVGGGQPLVLLSPEWAAHCRREGLSKSDIKEQLWRRARCPLDRLPGRLRRSLAESRAKAGHDPAAALLVAERPEDVLVVVAGGIGVKQTVIPNWAGGTRAVTGPLS